MIGNAGLGVRQDGLGPGKPSLVIRIELGPTYTTTALATWKEFYRDRINTDQGPLIDSFRASIPHDLVKTALKAQMQTELVKQWKMRKFNADDGGVPKVWFEKAWASPGGVGGAVIPQVVVEFTGEVPDACGWPVSIDLDVRVRMTTKMFFDPVKGVALSGDVNIDFTDSVEEGYL